MINSINSQSENLADIVSMTAATDSVFLSPFILILGAVLITAILLVINYRITHSDKGLLKRIQRQTKNKQITPREAAHKIAILRLKKAFNATQKDQLKTLRFGATEPSADQLIAFIHHVV